MTKSNTNDLEHELGGQGEGLAALDASDRKLLAAQVRAARQREGKALEKALDETLTLVPAVLRGAIKRLFQKT